MLKKVSVGEEVIANHGQWTSDYRIHTVRKVTPTGQITLDDGSRWNANGWRIGAGGGYLLEATQQIRNEIRADQIKEAIRMRLKAIQGDLATTDIPVLEEMLARLSA